MEIIGIESFGHLIKQELNIDLPESHRIALERISVPACNETIDARGPAYRNIHLNRFMII